jgi:FMN phosphatase YigB (HAD superfamily)
MIRAIAFDLGGVLTPDVWENTFFDQHIGLVARYGLDIRKARSVGRRLWNIYAHRSVAPGETWRQLERRYWLQFIRALDIDAPVDALIELSGQFIKEVDGMLTVLESLRNSRTIMAVCSNNTEFWFARQASLLRLHRFVSPDHITLSCRIGASKSEVGNRMFAAVAASLGIAKHAILLVDDRQRNVEAAVAYGMPALLFPAHSRQGAAYLHNVLVELRVIDA